MAAEQADFREAMSRLGAGVCVLASDGPAGRCALTVSAVCSVTDAPPTLLACVNRRSSLEPVFRANGAIAVNVLAPGQEGLALPFAGAGALPMEARMALAEWDLLPNGMPGLRGAAASLGGRIAETIERGTHSMFVIELEEVALGAAEGGLIWLGRRCHAVGAP